MKLVRTLGLFVALALLGSTSSHALHPGDCAYVCTNPTTGQTVHGTTQASPYACCSGTATFGCPVGYTYSETVFYVDSSGPELCSL
jgi:hypothetical protein